MTKWRYLAQDALTREWIDTDLALIDVEVVDEVSGPGGIIARIAPKDMTLADSDGAPILQEWKTILYAEADGEIRGQPGLLQVSTFNEEDQVWELDAPGLSSYPAGMPFESLIKGYQLDPFEVVRTIWSTLQGAPDGDLNVVVDDAVCPIPLGDPDPGEKPTSDPSYAWTVLVPGGGTSSGTGKPPHPGKSPVKGSKPVRETGESDIDYDARVDEWNDDWDDIKAVYLSQRDAYRGYRASVSALRQDWIKNRKEWEPYRLAWWEAPDCGYEIDQLAAEVPFEYRMESSWVDSESFDVEHLLRLAYPRVGRRRHDLRFVVGENVKIIPELERDGGEYGNYVLGLGKGEGKKMRRVAVGERDGRLRRVKVFPAKSVGSKARLRSLAADEHRRIRYLSEFDEIEVFDHPNAPLGSFKVGDEILVQVDVGWIKERVWHRVVIGRYKPDSADTMTLTLVRSERGI